ncbi:serine/threonine-protein kinase [Lentisphaera profundi]|uniref:Serine/threonine-protein kinase n=1 Tax=Lentisphaera profundi TaxID=1658616 RepID=A0ABY7VQT0_9BACT|nr:serine/threonine-protein kinase [Lentisphaera profundi]WDE96560.1 serine/threonine-protein kinase [Lentisphaera profundi]
MFTRDFLKDAFQEAVESPDAFSSLQESLNERYTDAKFLGEGGLKKVYQVMDRATGRLVAMALPKAESREAHDLFIREARLQSLLEHPNIISLHDMGLKDNKPWFTMKLIHGQRLDEYIKNFDANIREKENRILDIFTKICDALSYAHSQNVLHLDLKPENIFVDDYGEVLVGDWGLGRLEGMKDLESDGPLPSEHLGQGSLYGYMTGTPGYMAPEQCQKGSKKSFYSDIYSLGGVLHFILTGLAVHKGSTEEKISMCKRGKVEVISEQIPRGLLPILLKCLEFNTGDRYDSVNGLKGDIDAYRSGFLTSAEQGAFGRQLQLLFKRNRRVCYLIFISLLMVLLLSSGFMYELKKSESLARANELRALEQRQRSEENLAKYLSTEKKRQAAVIKLAESYVSLSDKIFQSRQGRSGYDSARDKEAYELISGALSVDGGSSQSWALKGRLAIRLDYIAEAKIAFSQAGLSYQRHVDLCEKTLLIPNALERKLVLLEGLLKVRERALMYDMVFKFIYSDLDNEDKAQLIHRALSLMNNSKIKFVYDHSKRSLDISENPKLVLIFPIKNMDLEKINISESSLDRDFPHVLMPNLKCLIANRHKVTKKNFLFIEGHTSLRDLSVAYSQTSDLSYLSSLKLEALDIRGIPCKDYSVLKKCSELKVIYCLEDQQEMISKQVPKMKLVFDKGMAD